MHVENVKASRHWHLWREFADDRWIPRTKSQLRGKFDFHLSGSNILNTMGWSLMISVELWAVPIVHAFDSPWNLPHGPHNRFGFRRSINRRHPSFSTGARMSARADRGRGHRSAFCCVSSLDHLEELWVIGGVRPLPVWRLSILPANKENLL